MDILSCLLHYPWRTLTALGAVYGVPVHHRHPKEKVAQELSAAIRTRLRETLSHLSPDTRAALRALAQAKDLAIPRAEFIARFGALNPHRPWRQDAPPGPWPTPRSPAATLVHHGLVYPLNRGSTERPFNVILLPKDLCDAVAKHLDVTVIPSTPTPEPFPAPARAIDANEFTFLSFLNRCDYPVRHGRWLPPRAIKSLNRYLAPPDDLGAGRSELQAARIPFLHYLAERAGLVGLIGGYLKPTLLADGWLTALRPERLRALWDVWRERCDENRALWSRYRLPALEEDDDPVARFHVLLRPLVACPVGPLGHPTDLLDALVERSPALLRPQASYAAWAALDPAGQADFESRARAVLLEPLTGPLVWFGILFSFPFSPSSCLPVSSGSGIA